MINGRIRFFLTALILVCGCAISNAWAQVPPYYPEVKPVKYVSRVVPKSEVVFSIGKGSAVGMSRFEKSISLDGTWKFSGPVNSDKPFDKNVDLDKGFQRADFNDASWDNIKVPLNWYDQYPQAQQTEAPYVKGWYRKSISVPASEYGKSIRLHFGVIGYKSDLYINGKYVGSSHGDFNPWTVDITKFVKYGDGNKIALRVMSDFGPSFGLKTGAVHAYGDQWGIGDIRAGMWQSARALYAPNVYVKRALITPDLKKSSISVEYWVQNTTSKTQVLNLQGIVKSAIKNIKDQPANVSLGRVKLVPGENHGTVNIRLKNPRLWTPDDPHLYYLILALSNGKQVTTAHAERFGYRDFKIKGTNFEARVFRLSPRETDALPHDKRHIELAVLAINIGIVLNDLVYILTPVRPRGSKKPEICVVVNEIGVKLPLAEEEC